MTPRHHISPAIGLLRPVALLAGGLALAPLLPAADITWRGGFSDSFGDARNWNLPPDIPEDTPADQRESFRRVPGFDDVAIITSGPVVVSTSHQVTAIETGAGVSLVIRAGANLRVGQSAAGKTNLVTDLLVQGGALTFFNTTRLTELLEVSGGQLEFVSPAAIEAAVILGNGRLAAHSELRATRAWTLQAGATLEVSSADDPFRQAVFEEGLHLEGTQTDDGASRLTLRGRIQCGSSVDWGNTHVSLNGELILQALPPKEPEEPEEPADPGDPPQPKPVLLRLVGAEEEGEPLQWTGGSVRITATKQDQGVVRQDKRPRRFGMDLTLNGGGIHSDGGEAELTFTGTVTVRRAAPGSEDPIFLRGPCLFRDNAQLVADELIELDLAADADGRGFEFRDRSQFRVRAIVSPLFEGTLVRVADLVFEGQSQLFSGGGFGRVCILSVETNAVTTAPKLAMRGGRAVTDGALLHLRVGAGGRLEFGGRAAGASGDLVVNWLGGMDLNGDLAILRNADGSGTLVEAQGVWTIQREGRAQFAAGCGVTLKPGGLANLGTLILASPDQDTEPAPSLGGGTLVNDGGRVEVRTNAWLKLDQGVFLGGSLILGDGTTLEAGSGPADSFFYRAFLPNDQVEDRRVSLNGMLNLHAAAFVEVGRDARVILTRGSLADAGGLFLDQPLEVDHLQMGGEAEQLPRVVFGRSVRGLGLVVNKTFAWFGGQFRGEAGHEHQVLLPVGSAADLRSTEDNPGASVNLIHCRLLNRGSMIINTARRVGGSGGLFQPDSLVNEPGGRILVLRADRVDGLLNQGEVVQRLAEGVASLGYGEGANEGTFRVERGGVRFGPNFALRNFVNVNDPDAVVDLVGATVAEVQGASLASTVLGAKLTRIQGITIEGDVRLDDVEIQTTFVQDHTIRSMAGKPGALHLGGQINWTGGHISVQDDSKITILPGADMTIATTDPNGFFTRWERGTIENRGKITQVLGTTSKMVMTPNSRLITKTGGVFQTVGVGEVLASQFAFSPGELINDGGQVLLNVPRGANQKLRAKLTQKRGQTRIGPPSGPDDPGGERRAIRPARPGRHALVPREFIADFDQFIDGGVVEFFSTNFEAEREYNVRFGGRVRFLGNSTAKFKGLVTMTSGAIEFLDDSDGDFRSLADIRGGIVDIGPDATVISFGRFELINGGVLSGLGKFFGSVRNTSGVISPGVNEARPVIGALSVSGDVIFGPNATLELDLPVDAPVPVGDRLLVEGRVTLAGTVTVTPVSSPVRLAISEFYEAVRFGTAVGEFTRFVTPIGGGKDLKPEFREAPGRFGFKVVDVAANVDLALTAEAPLTAPAGGEITLRFTVKNRSDQTATGVALDVILPANASLAGSDPAGTVASGRLTVPLPNLPGGAETTATVRLTAPLVDAAVAVEATVGSNQPDLPIENNTTRVTTAVLVGGTFTVGRFELTAGGKLKLTFETLPGVRYRLERSTDLVNWLPHRDFLGDGTAQTADNLGGEGREPEFFRLVIL